MHVKAGLEEAAISIQRRASQVRRIWREHIQRVGP